MKRSEIPQLRSCTANTSRLRTADEVQDNLDDSIAEETLFN